MRAFVFDSYNGPIHEASVSEPEVGARDVLVRVEAAGVNPLDLKILHGAFRQILPYSPPQVLGYDVAGTVVHIGDEVTSFKPGDEVYARVGASQMGTFAERVAVAERDLALRPTSISTVEAASLPLVALTAWQALIINGGVKPGQKVLIHAGAGGVGSIAIQLAKHLGATVATTASAANLDFVRGLGADVAVDYRNQDFTEELSGYDLVLESLGGENLERSLQVLKPGGKVIGIAGPPDPAFADRAGLGAAVRSAFDDVSKKIRNEATKLGVTYEFLFMEPSGEQLTQITALVDDGNLRPVVAATYPFEETPEALEALTRGGLRGKVVIEGS